MVEKEIVLFGVNHKTTPLEVREKIAFADNYRETLGRLKVQVNCHEFYLLSTCNRVEILVYADVDSDIENEIIRFLFAGKVDLANCSEYLYVFRGLEAVEHLFSVAASLDSMVVGEAQILGQLKQAYRYAARFRCTGPLLNRLLHKSFSVAKRIRTETGIGAAAVSISYAAVQLARKIFGSLKNRKVMLIGAGEMAELAAEHLVGHGAAEVVVVNRTLSRGVKLAEKFNGRAVPMDQLYRQLEEVDIIISSTGAKEIIIFADKVKEVMRSRCNRPLFFIDIAVPRDLDPKLNDLENVDLYDIDDLSQVVEMNKSERSREAVKAERIVKEETGKFDNWYQSLAVTPTILSLRKKVDQIIAQELKKTMPRLDKLDDREKQSIEKMVNAVSAKILHDPLIYLKTEACHGRDKSQEKVNLIRSVFGLKNGDQS